MSVTDYIISFLLDVSDAESLVGYTSDRGEWHKYKVIIIPSNFFKPNVYGTPESMPQLPLKRIEGVPLLFGEDSVCRTREQVFVKADIIASAYFLLSRYEEMINPKRDVHGRFSAAASLPGRAGFLNIPIVDEYGRLLRKWLSECGVRLPMPKSKYSFVMSHDVDSVAQYRSLRGLAGGVLRGKAKEALSSFIKGVDNDPLFTFGWMHELEKQLGPHIKVKTFLKVAGKRVPQDIPYFNPYGRDVKRILELYPSVGLHVSYEAALNPELIKREVEILSDVKGAPVKESRHHYLASLEPSDMQYLIDAGITDDYTMGYADIAGFRIGTSRAVRWIDPKKKEVTKLTLHPLSVMDCTLSRCDYMNLSLDDAFSKYKEIRMEALKYGGEFVVLWHNTSVAENSGTYHRELFEKIIRNEESAYSL